jgi:hypothetical protein
LLIVAVPEAFSVTVWLGFEPIWYVTVAPGVPVMVTEALLPEQIVVLEAIVATGSGSTVIVTEPLAGCEQLGVPEVATLTSVMTVVDE